MSLVDVVPYVRGKMNSLNFDEHEDAFNQENLGGIDLTGKYHILEGTISEIDFNQTAFDAEFNLSVTVFFKGFRKPLDAKAEAIKQLERILDSMLDFQDIKQSGFKKLKFVSGNLEPLDISNDNDIKLVMEFVAMVTLCFKDE